MSGAQSDIHGFESRSGLEFLNIRWQIPQVAHKVSGLTATICYFENQNEFLVSKETVVLRR